MTARKRVRTRAVRSVSTEAVVTLRSLDEVRIASRAKSFSVSVVKLRDKIKVIKIKEGSVVANALDQADVSVEGSARDLDIRVNGQKASLLQVLHENDTIYIASKVSGA